MSRSASGSGSGGRGPLPDVRCPPRTSYRPSGLARRPAPRAVTRAHALGYAVIDGCGCGCARRALGRERTASWADGFVELRTSAQELAAWLGWSRSIWSIHGEPVLAAALPGGVDGPVLADVLRPCGRALAVMAPADVRFRDRAFLAAERLDEVTHAVGNGRVLQLAWIETSGGLSDAWLLAELALPSLSVAEERAAHAALEAPRSA